MGAGLGDVGVAAGLEEVGVVTGLGEVGVAAGLGEAVLTGLGEGVLAVVGWEGLGTTAGVGGGGLCTVMGGLVRPGAATLMTGGGGGEGWACGLGVSPLVTSGCVPSTGGDGRGTWGRGGESVNGIGSPALARASSAASTSARRQDCEHAGREMVGVMTTWQQ